jgi:hypothetical protein
MYMKNLLNQLRVKTHTGETSRQGMVTPTHLISPPLHPQARVWPTRNIAQLERVITLITFCYFHLLMQAIIMLRKCGKLMIEQLKSPRFLFAIKIMA